MTNLHTPIVSLTEKNCFSHWESQWDCSKIKISIKSKWGLGQEPHWESRTSSRTSSRIKSLIKNLMKNRDLGQDLIEILIEILNEDFFHWSCCKDYLNALILFQGQAACNLNHVSLVEVIKRNLVERHSSIDRQTTSHREVQLNEWGTTGSNLK